MGAFRALWTVCVFLMRVFVQWIASERRKYRDPNILLAFEYRWGDNFAFLRYTSSGYGFHYRVCAEYLNFWRILIIHKIREKRESETGIVIEAGAK